MLSTDNIYFAKIEDPKEMIKQLDQKIDMYYEYCRNTGRLSLWRNVYFTLLSSKWTSGRILKTGDELEFKSIKLNHFYNIVNNLVIQVSSNKVAWDAQAINSDVKSMAQCKIANKLLDAQVALQHLDEIFVKTTNYAVCYGVGYTEIGWDTEAGGVYWKGFSEKTDKLGNIITKTEVDELGQEIEVPEMEEQTQFYGDVYYSSCGAIDVAYDVTVKNFNELKWKAKRIKANRYDLAEQFPEVSEDILRCESKLNRDEITEVNVEYKRRNSDYLWLWKFWHERTTTIPEGRYTLFIENGTILYDGKLPYDEIPLYKMTPQEDLEGPWGHTVSFELLPIQEAINKLGSAIMSNQLKFAVGSVLVPKGSGFSVSQLLRGLKLIEYDHRVPEPKALNLTATPPEVFTMLDRLVTTMEQISAINSVIRGTPEANLRSGNMLDTLVAQAYNFYRGLERSYNSHNEMVGTAFIKIMQRYSTRQKPTAYVGEANRWEMKYFSGAELDKIQRIFVQQANPALKTLPGRIIAANNLLQKGLIRDPRQYLQVMESGQIDPGVEADESELLLIQSETQDIADGINCPVNEADYHQFHALHHFRAIANPDARKDPKVLEAFTYHVGEHARMAGFMVQGLPDIVGFMNYCRGIQGPPSGQAQQAKAEEQDRFNQGLQNLKEQQNAGNSNGHQSEFDTESATIPAV